MKHKLRLFSVGFGAIALGAFALATIGANNNFVTFEKNFQSIKAKPFYDRKVSDEPEYPSSKAFQFDYMGVGNTWDTVRGENVTVAVIDSGINIYHEDYLTEEAQGKTINASNVAQYSILDPRSAYIYDSTDQGLYTSKVKTEVGITKVLDTDTYDDYYDEYYSHGTCSAGCIGAAVNGVGTAGLAPNVNLLIIKIDFWFNSLDVAVRYAADCGADVINMSLGAYAESFKDGYGDQQDGVASTATILQDAIDYAYEKGVVVCASAGNENQGGHKSYPACNKHVIGVGALEKKSGTTRASFSNWNVTDSSGNILENNNVDVTAPGYVWVPMVDDANNSSHYNYTQGTSFSCPLTAAACALYKSKYPTATPDQIAEQLFNTCDDIGAAGFDSTFGHGRVNVANLLADEPKVKVTEVNVTPENSTIYVDGLGGNATVQLSATCLPENADESLKQGLWISDDDTVATVNEDTGLVTAVSEGTTRVGFLTESNVEGYATIVVRDNHIYNVESISLNKTSASLAVGGTVNLTVNFTPANATDKEIVWTSSDDSVATVNNGVVLARKTGTSTITATSHDGGHVATCLITVTTVSETIYGLVSNVEDLALDRGVMIVASSADYALGSQSTNNRGAAAITKDTTSYDVTTVEKTSSVASLTLKEGSVEGTYAFYDEDNSGYLCAASSSKNYLKTQSDLDANASFTISISSNNATVVAQGNYTRNSIKYNANNGSPIFSCYASGLTPVHLYQQLAVGDLIPVESVTLSQSTAEVTIGETLTLTASVSPVDASNQKITWTSSNTSVATVSGGVVTTTGVGTTTITAKSNNGIEATCLVTVNPINVTKIELNKTATSLVAGQSESLTATITPTNATNKGVTWSTSDNTIATVSSSGEVKAVAQGEATITATTADGGLTAQCVVSVVARGITSIDITSNASKTSYYVGDTFSTSGLVVKATYNDGSIETITSVSSITTPDMSVAGTKTITISYNGFTTSYTIEVIAVVMTAITVDASATKTTYNINEAFESDGLVVNAQYNNGNSVALTSGYTLSTPDMSTAGTKTITVTYGEFTASYTIKVVDQNAAGSYQVTFKSNSKDGSAALTATTVKDEVTTGANYVSSFDSITKVFAGKSGLKLGSSGSGGSIVMNLDQTACPNLISSITLHTAKYGTDSAKIRVYVNNIVTFLSPSVTPSDGETTIELSEPTAIQYIKIDTNGSRAYLSGVDFNYEGTTPVQSQAETFANNFLNKITCSGSGSVTFSAQDWSDIAVEFNALSAEDKTILKTSTANSAGTAVEQCVARYDAIIIKYGTENYADFMERNPVSRAMKVKTVDIQDTTAIVAMIGIISISAIGIFVSKTHKKKEQ